MSVPPGLIDPSQFPFRSASMDVLALERAADGLRRLGAGVGDGAEVLVGAWDGLQGAYESPEQDRVYRLMDPVTTSAESLESDLSTAAGHLDDFAETLGVLRVRLMSLEQEAQAFRESVMWGVQVYAPEAADAGVVAFGSVVVPWDQDTETVKRNKMLLLDHAKLVEDITAAAVVCHNALLDLVPGADAVDDLVAVPAEQLMDGRAEFSWGVPVAEDRSWSESVDHGAYSFVFNLYAGIGALVCGYDAAMGERSNEFWGQSWVGFGNALLSLGVSGSVGLVTVANPQAASWALGRLPADQQEWLLDRHRVAGATGAGLVGIDLPEHLAGGDGLWRWREDAVATGTESVLNLGSMAVPAGGVGAGALRTGSVGARLLRLGTGALDLVVPGGSLAVQSGLRVVSGLRTAVQRIDEIHPVLPNPAGVVADAPGLGSVDEAHVVDHPVSDGLFGEVDEVDIDTPPDGVSYGYGQPDPAEPPVFHDEIRSDRYPGRVSRFPPERVDGEWASSYESGNARLPGTEPPWSPPDSFEPGVTDAGWRAEKRPLHWESIKYQMQVTGIRPNAADALPEYWRTTPSGGEISYDGHTIRNGGEVYQEVKNGWDELAFYPESEKMEAKMGEFVKQAREQVRALPDGALLEWHMSDPLAASVIKAEFSGTPGLGNVLVLYTPAL